MPEQHPILAFIAARIAEEEADALAADDRQPWATTMYGSAEVLVIHGSPGMIMGPNNLVAADPEDVRHIARQDPAATLARVAALRAVVKLLASCTPPTAPGSGMVEMLGAADLAAEAIGHLAAIWADHPDFDPTWRL